MPSIHQQSVRRGVLVNGLTKISNGFLSFLVLMLIAKYFGAKADTDAYLVTNALIYLFMLTGEGILGVAFVPVFIEYRENRGREEARALANSLFTFLLLILFALTVLVFLFAPQFASLLAPGFSPEAKTVTANLMRINSPLLFLVGVTGVAASVFFAYRSFTIPALGSCFMAWGQVCSLLLFGGRLGIYSIPMGAVVGTVVQAVVLLYVLEKREEGFRLRWNPSHPGMRRMRILVMPRLVAIMAAKMNIIIDRFFASTLQVGYVSALGYAQRVTQLPFMIVAEAVAKILLPVLSKHDVSGEPEQIREKMVRTLQWLNVIAIPLMMAFFVLSEPLIALLFQRGSFSASDTRVTAQMLIYYNFGLLAYSYNPLLHVVFYSLQDTTTPMKIAFSTLILNLILDVVLMRIMGLGGIALCTSVVGIVRAFLLLYFLGKKIGGTDYYGVFKSILRISLASVPMGMTLWLLTRTPVEFLKQFNLLGSIVQLSAGSVVAGFVFLGVCHLMNIDESRQVIQYFRKGAVS